ncbi:hypothetical protein FACS1894109_06640 [Spirochaetia bacterium]|nr:hypothetical protein FACS1894109_06640 [Spirochaetia bacterium]
MTESFQDVLGKLIKEHGMALLNNSARCNALLQDYTQGQFRKESRLLLHALEAGYYTELKNTQDPEITKQKLIQKFQDEYGIAKEPAEETVSLLMGVLNNTLDKEVNRTRHCKTCGKELQDEWKTCPYCSVAVKGKERIPSTVAPTQPLKVKQMSDVLHETPSMKPQKVNVPHKTKKKKKGDWYEGVRGFIWIIVGITVGDNVGGIIGGIIGVIIAIIIAIITDVIFELVVEMFVNRVVIEEVVNLIYLSISMIVGYNIASGTRLFEEFKAIVVSLFHSVFQ